MCCTLFPKVPRGPDPRARSLSREEDSCASRRTPCTCLHLHLHLYSWSVLQGAGSWENVGRQVREGTTGAVMISLSIVNVGKHAGGA